MICLSPGVIAAGAACGIITCEIVFIIIKRAYALRGWKRPLLNKIIAATICLLYVGASLTDGDTTINELIPLLVLLLLMLVVVVGVIGSVYELY